MVGVLPRREATCSIAMRIFRFAFAGLSNASHLCSANAASTVPPQVRKSFAVTLSPVTSRR